MGFDRTVEPPGLRTVETVSQIRNLHPYPKDAAVGDAKPRGRFFT